MNNNTYQFRVKHRDGSHEYEELGVPPDIEQRAENFFQKYGLTDQKLSYFEAKGNQLAGRLRVKKAELLERAKKAGAIAGSLDSLAHSDAQTERLEKVLDRVAELENYTQDLLIPWTKAQFMKALPWLAVAALAISFIIYAAVNHDRSSISTSKPQIQQEEIRK